MRHSMITRFGTLGVLICTIFLGLVACENEAEEPTGLEVEEVEIERDDGQIEEAEVELEREELDEIERPADDELVEALRSDEQQAEGEVGEQAEQMQPGQMQPGQMQPGQMEQDQLADQQQADQQQDIEAAFLAPIDYIGMPITGEATVADVVSDRGFWLTDGQNRIFTVVREFDERIDINEGQRIRLSGIIMAPADASDVVGPLEPQTQRLVEEQTAFVSVFWRNIEILEQADEAPVGGGPDEQEQQPMDEQQDQK